MTLRGKIIIGTREVVTMGVIKHLMQENNNKHSTPSHLEKEMYEEIIMLKEQITKIHKILEECK